MTTQERLDVIDVPSENGTANGASAHLGSRPRAERTGAARRMDVVGLTAGFGATTSSPNITSRSSRTP